MSVRAIDARKDNQMDLHVQLSLDPQHGPGQIGSSPSCRPQAYNPPRVHSGSVHSGSDGVSIYYEVHGLDEDGVWDPKLDTRPRVVMIMGLACGCKAWRWQLQDLLQLQSPAAASPIAYSRQQDSPSSMQSQSGRAPMVVCVLDNRGCGLSSAPQDKQQYSTEIMARDALGVMDHLGWASAHICGFSLGGMISTKLAVMAPQRVQSLTIISSTAGGWQILPNTWRGIKMAVQMVMARTPEDAVDVTLRVHFTKRTLKEWVERHRAVRRELLRREYLAPDGSPMQPPHGFQGQMHACWTHGVSDADVRAVRSAKFPVVVIHGRHDLLAAPEHGEALAKRLHAPLIMLEGAHFIVRECAGQVNMLLSSLVLGQRHFTAVRNDVYLDPDPALQKAWQEGEAAAAAVGAAVGAVAGAGV